MPCSHCQGSIEWETPRGIWAELEGTPAWMMGPCPHCGKALLLLLNTNFYGDTGGTHMVHMDQGPDFSKVVPWDRMRQSRFYLDVKKGPPDKS